MRIAASSASCRANLRRPQQFLESVLDNVPVCVAAKSIEDGRYIFANRAFERFSRFPATTFVGKRADEIFQTETAARHRGGGPVGAQFARWPVPQRISWSSAAIEEARYRQQPRDRAQRQEASRNS